MIVLYNSLSDRNRRSAQRLAKKLLHKISADENAEIPQSLCTLLNMPFVRPQNVHAVRIYDDGANNWRGEIVLNRQGNPVQVGQDCRSVDDSLTFVKAVIARIKAKDMALKVDNLKQAA